MDLVLPGLNGIDATVEVRSLCPTARGVIVTNYNDANLRQAAASAGAFAFICKDSLLELRGILAPPACEGADAGSRNVAIPPSGKPRTLP